MRDIKLNLGWLIDGTKRPFLIPFAALLLHFQILAPTQRGKSRLLTRIVFEVLQKCFGATVIVLDPKGDLARHLRREGYQRGYSDRMIFVNPSDTRRVPGFNIVRPWGNNSGLQAAVARDLMVHSMGAEQVGVMVRFARWCFNTFYWLLAASLPARHAIDLLDPINGAYRQAVLPLIPDSGPRRDLLWLDQLTKRPGAAMRIVDDNTGSTLNRFRLLADNDVLGLMLGTERAIDFDELVGTPGRLIAVALDDEALSREDVTHLGLAFISEIWRACRRRPADARTPIILMIDEAGLFANSPDLADILDRGAGLGLSLGLVHQHLEQLSPDPADRRLRFSVLQNANTKIVMGGLAPEDGRVMSEVFGGHLVNFDRRKLEIPVWRQLHHLEYLESVSRGTTRARGSSVGRIHSRATGRSSAHASGWSAGHGGAMGFGMGATSGETELHGVDGSAMGGGISRAFAEATQEMNSWSSSDSAADITGESEIEGESTVEAEAESTATSNGRTRGPVIVPGDPFRELSSVQFESPEEQVGRLQAAMIAQPTRHAMSVIGKESPVSWHVADVPDPRISEDQARIVDLDLMNSLPFYSSPEDIEVEIVTRERALLMPQRIGLVDPAAALERRRAARRARVAKEDDEGHAEGDGATGIVPIAGPVRPRAGRGAVARKIVREA